MKIVFLPNERRRDGWPAHIDDKDPKLHLLIREIMRDINNQMGDIVLA